MNAITDRIVVGDIRDAAAHDRLAAHEVSVVLTLTHSDPERAYPDSVRVVAVPMVDGPQNEFETFERAVDELRAALDAGETVFVHCTAGASRSVSVVAAALAVRENLPLPDAFAAVADERPVAQPHEALIRQAERYLDA
jgi:protein-tyrosine phosphatase